MNSKNEKKIEVEVERYGGREVHITKVLAKARKYYHALILERAKVTKMYNQSEVFDLLFNLVLFRRKKPLAKQVSVGTREKNRVC